MITSYHEREQRKNMSNYTSTKYFNTSLIGLSGKIHPALDNVFTSKEVQNMRPHLKLLAGDYLSNEKLARHGGKSPLCDICDLHQNESYSHIISRCKALEEPRHIMLNILTEFCHSKEFYFFDNILQNDEELTQFILDPTSMNLTNRVNFNDRNLPELMNICRNFCNSLHCLRKMKKEQLQQE